MDWSLLPPPASPASLHSRRWVASARLACRRHPHQSLARGVPHLLERLKKPVASAEKTITTDSAARNPPRSLALEQCRILYPAEPALSRFPPGLTRTVVSSAKRLINSRGILRPNPGVPLSTCISWIQQLASSRESRELVGVTWLSSSSLVLELRCSQI